MAAGDPMELSRRHLLLFPALAPLLMAAAPRGWSNDGFFGRPIIDIDEQRVGPRPHRFVHGHFEGTDTRFLVALPEAGVFRDRSVQWLQGGRGGDEYNGYNRATHGLAFEQGAVYVETNQSHVGNDMGGLKGDLSILNWRASAQAARFARELAKAHYGRAPRFGYVLGGSGGGMRSISCMEAEPDLWQGAVPFMINRSGLIIFNWSIAAWAGMVLEKRLPALSRAGLEGSDPFAVLETEEERAALASLYRAGYPRGAEDQLGPNPLWILGMQMILAQDARYFVEFWRTDGYEGKAAGPQVQAMTLETTAEVEAVLTGDEVAALLAADEASELTGALRGSFKGEQPAAVRLKGDLPTGRMLGASLVFETGAASGRRVLCTGSTGGALTASLDPASFAGVAPGDRLAVSNKALVAFIFYHRHFVDARYLGMDEFFENGRPRYAQRPVAFDALEVPTGALKGKMILLQHRLDREALATCAEPYIQSVRRNLEGRTDEAFRVWWLDNAQHGVPQNAATRYINFRGAFSQALVDVIAWVEAGMAPPPSTAYRFDAENQLVLPPSGAARRGIQPVVRFEEPPARAKAGAVVALRIAVEIPPGAGQVVSAALDLDGSGAFATPMTKGAGPGLYQASATFARPGRPVVTARVEIERTGRADGYRVANLVRTVVMVA